MRGAQISILILFLLYGSLRADLVIEERKIIIKGIISLTKIVNKYDEKIDKSAKFPELKTAITAIAASMGDYQGKAHKRLPKIRQLNTDAYVEYTNCVGPMYEWCSGMIGTHDLVSKIIDSNSNEMNEFACFLINELLENGLENANSSLTLLKDVQLKTGYLKDELENMLDDIKFDFGGDGVYGQMMRTYNYRKKRGCYILHVMFSVVVTIVLGPVGKSLGLIEIFQQHGFYIQYYPVPRNSQQYKIESIKLLFKTLEDRTHEAIRIAEEVQFSLVTERSYLSKLKGLIIASKRNGRLLLSHDKEIRQMVKPSLNTLRNTCVSYEEHHSNECDERRY